MYWNLYNNALHVRSILIHRPACLCNVFNFTFSYTHIWTCSNNNALLLHDAELIISQDLIR